MKRISFFLGLLAALMLVGCGGNQSTNSETQSTQSTTPESMTGTATTATTNATLAADIVATVNGKEISKTDLAEAMNDLRLQYQNTPDYPASGTPEYAQLEKQVAERLANEQMIWFEAAKLGISPTEADITAHAQEARDKYGSEEAANQLLASNQLTQETLREASRKSFIFQALYAEVTKGVTAVTDEQALKYYNENQAQFGQISFEAAKEDLKKGLAMENQRLAFEAWFNAIQPTYTVVYAAQYKPTSTTPAAPN